MAERNTTLAVSKDFAEKLRKEYDGHNDEERLENWALDCYESSYKESISLEDVEIAVTNVIEQMSINDYGEVELR